MVNNRKKGGHFEQIAQNYLKDIGLKFICKNYYCEHGEIDLIFEDEEKNIRFIEVKSSVYEMDSLEYLINDKKKKSIKFSLENFILNNEKYKDYIIAIDIVYININTERIHYLPDSIYFYEI